VRYLDSGFKPDQRVGFPFQVALCRIDDDDKTWPGDERNEELVVAESYVSPICEQGLSHLAPRPS
jgi:hypothetical protein